MIVTTTSKRPRHSFTLVLMTGLMFLTLSAFADITPCEQHIRSHEYTGADDKTLANEISDYQQLIEESFVYQAKSIELAKRLKENIRNDIPLTGADLHALNEGLIAHLSLRKKLFQYAEMHECWLESDTIQNARSKERFSQHLQGVMLSLSAALTLYDNYILAISIFQEDDKLRRFLNSEDAGYNKNDEELAAVTLSYNSINNRARVRRAIHFYEQYKDISSDLEPPDNFAYLNLLISQSPSYKLTRDYAPFMVLGNKLRFLDAISADTLNSLSRDGINMFSMFFGNTVGLIENRKGKLYKNKKIIKKVKRQLKAGDILLEKTPFRLTDKFIPGHWGHAAIWVGSEQELKSLGIWKHPLVRKYHRQIKNGHSVVEALRNGVVMSTLDDFMNIDDLGVLRTRADSPADTVNTILMALRQIGKAYDFNFDVESTDKIVCSELIYVSFTHIDWPTTNTLGRYTISPDNIAIKTLGQNSLQLIMLVHDGQHITKKANTVMASLLDDNGMH